MNNFDKAFKLMIQREGGYILTNIKNDRGKQTYSGISRRYHNNWKGWGYIDNGDMDNPQLKTHVRDFYYENFWKASNLDQVEDFRIAFSIFDYGVNSGRATSVKIAQVILDLISDGVVGPKTIEALNGFSKNEQDTELFILKFALAKIARYKSIVERDHTQFKFLLGWINRTLESLRNNYGV